MGVGFKGGAKGLLWREKGGRGRSGEGCGEVMAEVGKGGVLWGREECSLSKVTHLPLFMKVFSQGISCLVFPQFLLPLKEN